MVALNSRLNRVEERTSNSETDEQEMQSKHREKKNAEQIGQNTRNLWENIKWSNIYVTGVSEGDERENREEMFYKDNG